MAMQTEQGETGRAALEAYARGELRGEPILRGYRPKTGVLREVSERLPRAHLVVVSRPSCGDCRREVPKMARILEHMPDGWSVELRGEDQATTEEFNIQAVPTFIVLPERGGVELGRIIESPDHPDGLEGTLLEIAERHAPAAA